ncbi:sorcin-like [Patiria miniata]|uniref:Peflin n=1 Tax=Patiria miniata TaxID=46514 RepID=A0A914AKM2_PATMI|nr:sorcin-like [Patiria miniata]
MSWGGQQPAYNPNYQAHGQRPPMQGYHPSQPPPHQMSYGAPQHGYGAPPPQYNPQQYPAATGQQPGYQQPGYQQPGMPPGADPTLWHWFQAVDADHSGSISATELRQALVNGNWSHFNEETCRLMIGMFDKDRNGTINFSEFAALWKYIQDWKSCFERFDQDRSGNIDANELHHALKSFGYNVTPGFCSVLVQKFDRSDMRTMKLDDFIQCCVMIRSLTEAFKKKDAAARGIVRICYEDFLEMVLENAIH